MWENFKQDIGITFHHWKWGRMSALQKTWISPRLYSIHCIKLVSNIMQVCYLVNYLTSNCFKCVFSLYFNSVLSVSPKQKYQNTQKEAHNLIYTTKQILSTNTLEAFVHSCCAIMITDNSCQEIRANDFKFGFCIWQLWWPFCIVLNRP